jgi:dephospho-CoA kinase
MGVPFVGLTGGLGAGKSTALAALERLGAVGLDTDAVVHELYETAPVRAAVRERWGAAVFAGERVDRGAIARRTFADEHERTWLEELLWPLVGAWVGAFHDELQLRSPPPVAGVVETPLLFEAGVQGRFDATIAIVADDGLRAEWIAARDQEELAARERRQLSQEEKARRASYVVVNDGSVAELEAKLAEILRRLRT